MAAVLSRLQVHSEPLLELTIFRPIQCWGRFCNRLEFLLLRKGQSLDSCPGHNDISQIETFYRAVISGNELPNRTGIEVLV